MNSEPCLLTFPAYPVHLQHYPFATQLYPVGEKSGSDEEGKLVVEPISNFLLTFIWRREDESSNLQIILLKDGDVSPAS